MNTAKLQKGFTLIEVLVSAALLVILGAGFVGLQYIFKENQVTAWQNYQNIEEGNRAITMIKKELRNVQESDNGSYPLEILNDQEIAFFSDVDYDGCSERIHYTLTDTQIIRGITDPVGTPATYPAENENTREITAQVRNGTDPIFYYYNNNWPEETIGNPLIPEDRIADTRMVRILLKINTKNDPRTDYLLETEVLLRILKES